MICFVPEIKESFKQGCQEKCIELYGWSGSLSIILAYGLASADSNKKILLDILNLYGSSAVGIVSYRGKVWPAVVLEFAWFGIASYSLIDNLTNN